MGVIKILIIVDTTFLSLLTLIFDLCFLIVDFMSEFLLFQRISPSVRAVTA